VYQGADAQRVRDGADAYRAAQQHAGDQHRDLDRGADDPDGVAALGQAGHQPVARSRAEAGPDVAGRGDRVDADGPRQHRHPDRQRTGRRDDVQGLVGHQSDDDRVADRAETGTLPQRDPGQQHNAADADDNPADRHVQVPGDALMQHVPRVQAEPGPDKQRHAHPEAGQAQVQPRDAG
jgi:hypothetical protein